MVVILILFVICCINLDSVSGSDDRISRLEKLVEAQNVMILGFKNEFDVLKDTVRIQNIKIDSLENQLQSCKACFDFKRSNNTSTLLPHPILPSRNKLNVETPKVGVPNNRMQKDLERNRRLLLSGSNGDSPPIIAFHAYLSKSEIDPGHHHTIIFDSVLSNSGNGYNNNSGTFIAPENGMYVFAYTVVGYRGSRMPVHLVVNSNIVGATATDSISDTKYPSASTVVVVYLNQNDTCFLRTTTNTGYVVGNLYSSDWSRSSFSAWKL
ncbi:uncharacterized protein LOC127706969 [Mytilus californianus]|uniref:uncharacterized protein LOC127706969 n=1 Tax=Mytilus californianus TaxID=6549 RepID=UPI002247B680|nr:uncharacterized protein LOC127706969 [Mytilus californianus]